MRNSIQKSKYFTRKTPRLGSIGLCLSCFLLANSARAGVDSWDPQGTSGPNPYTGNMSGIWENPDWTSSVTVGPTYWVEGDAAGFGYNTGFLTPAYTVTMNANHTIAGVYDGASGHNASQVTINGTGQWLLSGAQAFISQFGNDDAVAGVTINVPIFDGGTPGQVDVEGAGGGFTLMALIPIAAGHSWVLPAPIGLATFSSTTTNPLAPATSHS